MELSVTEQLRIVMKREHITVTELARRTGQTPQNLSNKLARDNYTVTELIRLADGLGYNVEIHLVARS